MDPVTAVALSLTRRARPTGWARRIAWLLPATLTLAGCQILGGEVVTLTSAPGVDITIHAVGGAVPAKAVTEQATEILGNRLRSIGVGNFSMAAGNDITVTVAASENLAKVRAVLGATGVVAFGALRDNADLPPVGSKFEVTTALWDGDQVEQASYGKDENGTQTVTIGLTPVGAAAFAAYSATHVGQGIVITLDGVVVAAPLITASIPDGHIVFTFPDPSVLPTDVFVAIVLSGPLPAAWRQP